MSTKFSPNQFNYDPRLMPDQFERLRTMHDVVLADQFAQLAYPRPAVAETANSEAAVRAVSAGLTQKIGFVTINGFESLAEGMSHQVEATVQEFFGAHSVTRPTTNAIGQYALAA